MTCMVMIRHNMQRLHIHNIRLSAQENGEASTSGVDSIPLETKLGISVRVRCHVTPNLSASIMEKCSPVALPDNIGRPVQVQNLYKNYHVKDTVFKAVQDATVDFPANKIIALLGPSGSGKTTLLRLIAGLESVTDGQIFFGGSTSDAGTCYEVSLQNMLQHVFMACHHMSVYTLALLWSCMLSCQAPAVGMGNTANLLCLFFEKLARVTCCTADQDATHIPVQQRQIGMVFQSYALFRHMTVADNISFGPRIQDFDIDEEER